MKCEIKQGVINNKQDMQNISGRMSRGTGHVRTKHKSVFNINEQTAELNGTGGLYFNEGDEVLAVGETASNNVFHIMGYKNLSTGVVQEGATIIPTIMGGTCVCFGLWTFYFVITPIIFLPIGGMYLWATYKNIQANKVLKSAIAALTPHTLHKGEVNNV